MSSTRLTDETAASALLIIATFAEQLATDEEITDEQRRHFARHIHRQAIALEAHLIDLEQRLRG